MSYLTYVFPIALAAFILLIFSEYAPLLRLPSPPAPARSRRITGRDRLVMLGLTLCYAAAAFAGLGDMSAPESVCRFAERGQYADFELIEETDIGNLMYFPSLKTGKYYLQFSSDGEDWQDVATLEQGYADLFKWKTAALAEDRPSAKYIRVLAGAPLNLAEIAIYDADGRLLDAGDITCSGGAAALIDEQDTVPARASYLNSSYFDEIYHARTALEHIEGVEPYEISHPPLGKLIIGLGIRIFGMNPFGWRFSGTLIGVLMLPALYIFLKKMFGGYAVPGCCTAIFAFDFMHFVQTRIATIDSYAVFFIILMYLFMYLYCAADKDGRARDWLLPLALSGLCFGLGAASKWTCIYAGAGLALIWLIERTGRIMELRRADRRYDIAPELAGNIGLCLLFFVALPLLIYYLSYYAYGTAKGMSGPGMFFTRDYFDTVVDNQKYMFSYHSGVHSEHPYSSRWWQWILDIRPILYYLEYFDDGTRSSFGAFVNPLLCWGGLLAMVCMAYWAIFRRDKKALFILIGYLAQLVPWIFIGRVTFEYHYFPSTVFLLLALGHVFAHIRWWHPDWRRVIYSFTAVSLVLFILFYPVLSGLEIDPAYGRRFLQWLPTWPF